MTRLQISVEESDGRTRVVGTERADARGRREVDRQASEWLARPEVVRVSVEPVDRYAQTGRRSYR